MADRGCYVCSEIHTEPCPNSGSDYSSWKSQAEKYILLDSTTSSSDQSCSLVVGASGRIYHQAPIDTIKCIDPRYRITLAQQIARVYRDPDSRVICCTSPGCNWSEALATSNSSPGPAGLTQQSDVVLGFVTAILLGFVVLVVCLFIFFIVFCRKENDEEENGTKLYFPQSTFDKKQRSNFASRDSSKVFDQRSNYNSPAESGAGPYGYNSQIKSLPRVENNYDEYDINGYRKDRRTNRAESYSDRIGVKANNYFNREERLAEEKTSKAIGKKPEWRNVYGKGTTQPADGAVNAFQWSE